MAGTLGAGQRGIEAQAAWTDQLVLGSQVDEGQARPLVARETGYRMDLESENFVVAHSITASYAHHGHSSARGDGADNLVVADPITTTEGKTYTHEGKNNFRTHNVIAFSSKGGGGGAVEESDLSPTVLGTDGNGGVPPAVVAWDDRNQRADDTHHTLRGAGLQRSDGVASTAGVRRLTPLECERLMGWPDGWTEGLTDNHRYRMCGNGVVAPVAAWIGHRLVAVDEQRRWEQLPLPDAVVDVSY